MKQAIEFHLNLFLPAISKIWPAFGHWQPAISSPESSEQTLEKNPSMGC
jgi:hypothetical protein